ncbi:hypothetical protein Tco_1352197, partial [Tanacetum coccineum]
GDLHWTTVKNILKYLRNTKDMFLVYGEAEYIAAYDVSKESIWVRKFIFGLGVVSTIKEPIKMYCDNTGAIAIANESGITKGARYFRAKVLGIYLYLLVPTGRYVVPTGRVIATDSVIVATSGYVVPAAYDIRPGRVK